jgi:hypothetical protein
MNIMVVFDPLFGGFPAQINFLPVSKGREVHQSLRYPLQDTSFGL